MQSAYKKGHSTETALLQIKHDIHLNMAKGNATALILLDLSAAFDTIDHDLLLARLSTSYGIGGKALNWFESYLSPRSQRIKVGDALSEKQSLEFGVPQGSVLGPLLFTLYTTELSEIIHSFPSIQHHL